MEHIATMRNHRRVYCDPAGPAATHFADTPHLRELIQAFLAQESFSERIVWVEHDTGRTIGLTDLVGTTDHDEIIYAKRLRRDTYTRFVKHRVPLPTRYVTVALCMDETGNYALASAWIGRMCPNFPDEPGAQPESKTFWSTHALVWGGQAVQRGTETITCPW